MMNSILVCLFVFNLGSLAVKIPMDVDKGEVPDLNVESLEKQSFDPSTSQHDASLITKKAVGKHSSDRWVKLNYYPVCFGARNNQFGRFSVPKTGNMGAVKLVHLYGYVSCDTRRTSYWSYWGCGNNPYAGIKDLVNVVITTSGNHIILPPSQFTTSFLKWSKIPGYNSLSPELVLSSFSYPLRVSAGQQLRLWYGEDLLNQSEGDNGGRACCDVYGLYV